MTQQLYCIIALLLATATCTVPPRAVLRGFTRYRIPVLALAYAAAFGAHYFDNGLFYLLSSFCASVGVLASVLLQFADAWSGLPAAQQNRRAAVLYPALVLLCTGAGAICGGTFGAVGAALAGVLLFACISARDYVKARG